MADVSFRQKVNDIGGDDAVDEMIGLWKMQGAI